MWKYIRAWFGTNAAEAETTAPALDPFLVVLFSAAITAVVKRPVRIRHITIRRPQVEHYPWPDAGRHLLHHSHGRN